MKRFLVIVITITICALLAVWSPWLNWNFDLQRILGVEGPEEIASLQVFSLAGNVEVLIDGDMKGNVSEENSPLIIDRVEPGERLITVRRSSEQENAFSTVSRLINFAEGTSVIFSYQIGPSEEFTQGHDIYAVEKSDTSRQSVINFFIDEAGATVQIDDIPAQQISENKLTEALTFDTQHKITVRKAGYEPLEFIILPETQEERDLLEDFDINVDVQLMLQPVSVE